MSDLCISADPGKLIYGDPSARRTTPCSKGWLNWRRPGCLVAGISKPQPPDGQESLQLPGATGCSQELAQFLAAFPRLQELRQQADCDPAARFKQGEALSAADDGERGLAGLQAAPRDE